MSILEIFFPVIFCSGLLSSAHPSVVGITNPCPFLGGGGSWCCPFLCFGVQFWSGANAYVNCIFCSLGIILLETGNGLIGLTLIWVSNSISLRAGFQLRVRNILLFQFLSQNICCVYSKKTSQWDGSFQHTQHMLKWMGKNIFNCSIKFIYLS